MKWWLLMPIVLLVSSCKRADRPIWWPCQMNNIISTTKCVLYWALYFVQNHNNNLNHLTTGMSIFHPVFHWLGLQNDRSYGTWLTKVYMAVTKIQTPEIESPLYIRYPGLYISPEAGPHWWFHHDLGDIPLAQLFNSSLPWLIGVDQGVHTICNWKFGEEFG